MKLRNKKTGDIWEFDGISMAISDSTKEKLGARGCSGACYARSLSKLNEEWEDVKPLIKDEKKRKAVREWAEANNIGRLSYHRSSHFWYLRAFNDHEQAIDFWLNYNDEPKLIENKVYTIDELCGEEDE